MSIQIDNVLTPEEIKVVQISLDTTIDDMTEGLKMPHAAQFNNKAINDMREMLKLAQSASRKIGLIAGNTVKIAPYKPGDEKEFLKP